MRNLDPNVNEMMLWDLFESANLAVIELKIYWDPFTLTSKCFGHVIFTNFDDSKQALKFDGTKLLTKQIEITHSSWKGVNFDQKVSSSSSYTDLCAAAFAAHADLTGAAKSDSLKEQFYYRIPNLSNSLLDENSSKLISKIH